MPGSARLPDPRTAARSPASAPPRMTPRHAAYLRVSALRNAVSTAYIRRPDVTADDVVEAAELFHDFLTRKDTP